MEIGRVSRALFYGITCSALRIFRSPLNNVKDKRLSTLHGYNSSQRDYQDRSLWTGGPVLEPMDGSNFFSSVLEAEIGGSTGLELFRKW